MQIGIGKDLTFDMDQSVQPRYQTWRKHLVLVANTGDSRLLGLVRSPKDVHKSQSEGFMLYHTLRYLPPRLNITPHESQRGRAVLHTVTPPIAVPYDTLAAATVHVMQYAHLMLVEQQDDQLRDTLFMIYQNHFDPPKVVRPGMNTDESPIAKP